MRCAQPRDRRRSSIGRRSHAAEQPRSAHRHRRDVAARRRSSSSATLLDARRRPARACRGCAERLDNPDPLTYVAHLRHGVTFHDGHELTSKDVVYTFGAFLDPAFVSPFKGAFRVLRVGDGALDDYTVEFTLKEPFGAFPIQLVTCRRSCRPARATRLRTHPDRHRPVPVRAATPSTIRSTLAAVRRLLRRRADATPASCSRWCPTTSCAALELRKGVGRPGRQRPAARHRAPARDGGDVRDRAAPGTRLLVPRLQHARPDPAGQARAPRDRLRDRSPRDRRVPAPRPRPPGDRPAAAAVVGLRARRARSSRYDPARAKALLDEAGYPRSGRRRPAAAAAPVAEGLDQRGDAAAGHRDPAGSAAGRHRSRRAVVRVRDALRRRAEGQLPAVHAAVGGRRARRSRHPAARVSLDSRCRRPASTAATTAIRRSIA